MYQGFKKVLCMFMVFVLAVGVVPVMAQEDSYDYVCRRLW